MVSNLHTHEFRCLIVFSFFLYFLTHYFSVVFGQIFVTLVKRLRLRPSLVLMLRDHWGPLNRSRLRWPRSLKQRTRLA